MTTRVSERALVPRVVVGSAPRVPGVLAVVAKQAAVALRASAPNTRAVAQGRLSRLRPDEDSVGTVQPR